MAALSMTSQAAITAAFDTALLNGLSGSASGNFNETFLDATTGVSVTLNFSLAATGGGSPLIFRNSNRIGVNSTDDTGGSGSSAVNLGETLILSVSHVSDDAASLGLSVQSLDFQFDNIAIYRNNSNSGEVTYTWASDGRTATQSITTTLDAGAAPDVGDDQTFDVFGGTYTGTLATTAQSAAPDDIGNGARIGTDGGVEFSVIVTAIPVPEPSSTALFGLGGLALMARRKR